jgi:hypothetical protein
MPSGNRRPAPTGRTLIDLPIEHCDVHRQGALPGNGQASPARSLPSTSPKRHTKSLCLLTRSSHGPLGFPRDCQRALNHPISTNLASARSPHILLSLQHFACCPQIPDHTIVDLDHRDGIVTDIANYDLTLRLHLLKIFSSLYGYFFPISIRARLTIYSYLERSTDLLLDHELYHLIRRK